MTTTHQNQQPMAFRPTEQSFGNIKRTGIYTRRNFVTSVSQAFIAASLALSMLTFVISLYGMLPIHDGDHARQESLNDSTLICLVMPLIVTYCSQAKVISAMTSQWILAKRCAIEGCCSVGQTGRRLLDKLRQVAAFTGLACFEGPMASFQEYLGDYEQPLGLRIRSS